MKEQVKKFQKDSGIKQSKFDNEKNRLYHAGQTILLVVDNYIKQIEEAKMINEQFFIDVLDKLNEHSVKY